MRFTSSLAVLTLFITTLSYSQEVKNSILCSEDEIIKRQLELDSNALFEIASNEIFTQEFVETLRLNRENRSHDSTAQYIIPVVLHVFHNGDDGKISMEQAQSGLDILNRDMQGLNTDWDDISPEFDGIKSSIDIQFCLASIDPNGNPTSGVNYYDDSLAMLNEGDLFSHAWDNSKYFNIYLPKYTGGGPSLFTAYAYYPNIALVEANMDGVFYSSIRWGYGDHSELADGQEWASVVTHEVGHWLNLRHTFENGCSAPGDYVDDTPPTTGGTIELSGCDNHDGSCGVTTNGENYMDYNHDCKKMFTQGQVDRMIAALYLDSRFNLWQESNLYETGCIRGFVNNTVEEETILSIYPNPASGIINFSFNENLDFISIFDAAGKLVYSSNGSGLNYQMDVSDFDNGMYFFQCTFGEKIQNGKFMVQ